VLGFDWGWAGEVNAWQTLATICVIIVALFVVARFLIRFWPWLKKLIRGVDAVIALPDFMEKTTEGMTSQTKKLDDIHHEVHYNNGTSVKDAMARVELGVKGIYHRIDALEEAVEDLHETDEKLSDQIEEQTQPHIAVTNDDPAPSGRRPTNQTNKE
jgi:uncharacterized protein YoxC